MEDDDDDGFGDGENGDDGNCGGGVDSIRILSLGDGVCGVADDG